MESEKDGKLDKMIKKVKKAVKKEQNQCCCELEIEEKTEDKKTEG
ncbi:hypothetical protein AMET1_1467 [Methanonatronarchaeum thermophilum]|uniref:Uncharacterized protein n=1 Tax=Methanonatronarchaeum thermophilum TaxID=1927129 RepID=A0A1Y3GAV4_9EURY|nr:hypothetical protein [Methanonatronarchaeum thermophilum]OUJ18548.1 hypothetical protein AMET1_1467 [Methanonatronarchaeum thermophilum]